MLHQIEYDNLNFFREPSTVQEFQSEQRQKVRNIDFKRALKVRNINDHYYALSELRGYCAFNPGATRFALAPGYYIARLWRFLCLAKAVSCD